MNQDMINSNSEHGTEKSDSSKDYGFIKNKIKHHFTDEELENNSLVGLIDIRTKRYFDNRQREQDIKRLDIPGLQEARAEKSKYYEDRSNSTWQQRLEYMWTPDEYSNFSPELQFVYEATMGSFIIAGLYGSWQESSKIYRIFLEQNKYTMFQHPREAQRALQDRVVLAMVQGGWKAGWRLGLLTGVMTSVCQSLSVIRNSINPLDYAAGGAAAGAVYRLNMGPRGMIGAGVGGAACGLTGGILISILQFVSGETVEERWRKEFKLIEEKKRVREEAISKKDVRGQEIAQEQQERKRIVAPVEDNDTPYSHEEEDWVRTIVIKIRGVFEQLGIIRYTNDSLMTSDSESVDKPNEDKTSNS